MELIEETGIASKEGLALTIGFFDGVHHGHLFLAKQLAKVAQSEGLKSAILTFWPHPRIILHEAYQPKLLNTHEEKLELLKQLPVDYCIQMEFTTEVSNLSAHDFMEKVLRDRLNVKHLLIGYDHRFGKNREEGFDDYCTYGEELGMRVTRAEPYEENNFTISSSFIRNLLGVGDIELANKYLGYNYNISGTVIHGKQNGRKLGFPTANIEPEIENKCIPCFGVFAVKVTVKGKTYKGVACIGTRPTYGGGEVSIEVNIFDFDEDIYGEHINMQFLHKLRAQNKFCTEDDLRTAISEDRIKAEKLMANE